MWAYSALLFGLSYWDYSVAHGPTTQPVLAAAALLLAAYTLGLVVAQVGEPSVALAKGHHAKHHERQGEHNRRHEHGE
jgi:hypothetical protein